jgi:tripartite ATP-independent transporter DctP family solute receptor
MKIPGISHLTLCLGLAFVIMTGAADPVRAEIKSRSIKMPIVNNIEHPQGVGAKKFAELIEQKSGGKIKVRVYAGGTLGGEQQVASAMQGGTIEVSMMAPAQLVGNFKDFLVLDFPFAFANEREADIVLDGPLGRKLLEPMPARGLVGLVYMEQGYRSITNSKRPITKLEDIQGLKIRTILNPLYIDMLNALGANAVPMPFPELYTALETGTVDGQENPYSTVEASKFDEVQKYFSNTRHIYNSQLLMASKKFWDSLSDEEKKIFEDAAVETRDYQRRVAREMDEKSRETLVKNGMQINDIAPEEIARMREKVKPVVEKYAAQVGEELTKELYAEIEKARARQ